MSQLGLIKHRLPSLSAYAETSTAGLTGLKCKFSQAIDRMQAKIAVPQREPI